MSFVSREEEPEFSPVWSMEQRSSLRGSVEELHWISRSLRRLGTCILIITLVDVGMLLWGLSRGIGSGYGGQSSLLLSIIVLAMANIAALGFFESLRKRGDAIFQELSDELQWHVGRPSGEGVPQNRPLLEARIAMRTFSVAAELPLVPGRFGGAVYAILNLWLAVAAASLFA